jgi:hypothetical protein
MFRAILAIIIGFAIWSALWLGGNLFLLPGVGQALSEGKQLTDPGSLAALLGLSVVCSLFAGMAAGRISRPGSKSPRVLAIILLLVGIAVQAANWSLVAPWYSVAFLLLLVPITLIGARITRRTPPTPVLA